MEDKKYLIIVNMQVDFLTGVFKKDNALEKVKNIQKEILDGDYKYLYTLWKVCGNDYENTIEGKKLPKHCINGSEGYKYSAEIIDAIQNASITSGKFINCIESENLIYEGWNYVIKDPTEITIVGAYTNNYVIANALQLRALFPKTKIIVKKSCCLGENETLNNQALQILKSCYVDVV